MRIEICGGIASGKTTLANALGMALNLEVIREDYRANPFLDDFYLAPERFAFETEVSFLLQHFHAIKASSSDSMICDYSLYQDYAYAKNNLSVSELTAFEQIYRELTHQAEVPSVILRTYCPPNLALQRIRDRGRRNESEIKVEYLESLSARIDDELNNVDIKIVSVDTSLTDYRDWDAARYSISRLLPEIRS